MKKKTSKGNAVKANAPVVYQEPKRVSIEKAGNGFVVGSHTNTGHKQLIAKSHKEAMSHVRKLMK